MARYRDNSPHPRDWTNSKLMREAREYANLVSFSSGYYDGDEITFKPGWNNQTGSPRIDDFVREQTRIYRHSWLDPILDEIESRFVKVK